MRWQGAGLEQTGAEGRPIVREVERVCGRLWRPQSRRCVAVKAEVPWAAKVLRDWSQAGVIGGVTDAPAEQAAARRNERELDRFLFGREGSASDRVGINPAEGRPLSSKHRLPERLIEVFYIFLKLFFPVLPEIPPFS